MELNDLTLSEIDAPGAFAYLGDVRSQYSDADGHLSMIDSVLGKPTQSSLRRS